MNARHDMVTVFVCRLDESGKHHELLQLYRAPDDYLGGTWQIVRGGVESGESYLAGATRELREETGLSPDEFYRLGSIESFYTAVDDTLWQSVAFCALVKRDRPVVLNDEHTAFRWLPRARIEEETMWASERALLADLFRDILDNGAAKPHLRVEGSES